MFCTHACQQTEWEKEIKEAKPMEIFCRCKQKTSKLRRESCQSYTSRERKKLELCAEHENDLSLLLTCEMMRNTHARLPRRQHLERVGALCFTNSFSFISLFVCFWTISMVLLHRQNISQAFYCRCFSEKTLSVPAREESQREINRVGMVIVLHNMGFLFPFSMFLPPFFSLVL